MIEIIATNNFWRFIVVQVLRFYNILREVGLTTSTRDTSPRRGGESLYRSRQFFIDISPPVIVDTVSDIDYNVNSIHTHMRIIHLYKSGDGGGHVHDRFVSWVLWCRRGVGDGGETYTTRVSV